jgi:NitT/TauT family transport system ATP-binding protein
MSEDRDYINARDVELGYVVDRGRGYFTACRDLSFSIERGKLVTVVGRSGAGKTSLLLALQGLVDVRTGSLTVAGAAVTGPSPDRGVVFQDASLFPWLSVRRNILFGLGRRRRDPEAVRRVDELIEIVGLTGFEHAHPAELSGGMQQRVNLARALAIDPGLLLLDEPFSALDPQTRSAMQTELVRIWQTATDRSGRRRTAVFVTHDLVEAVYLADQVIVMTPGPARIRAVVDIDLPRPRDHSDKQGSEIRGYVDRIAALMAEGETPAQLEEAIR